MTKILFAILILLAVSMELMADTPAWNAGHILLPTGQKLEGDISYNWKAEVVQVRLANGLLKAYSASNVAFFAFYDDAHRALRKFSSIDMASSSQQTRPIFMEECAIGRLSVYRRLRHTNEFLKIVRPSIYSNDRELLKDVDNFTYVVIDTDGQVRDLQSFEREVWPLMIDYRQQLTAYLKTRQLDTSSTLARLLLINQYNYLLLKQPDDHASVMAGQ